jgi:NAD(P)H-hydrate epimerase
VSRAASYANAHDVAADDAALAGERGLLPTDLLPALRRLANAGDGHEA